MNEVTKLYENVGIRPNYIDACTVEDKYWQNEELANEYGTFDMYMNAKCGYQEDCTTLCSCAYTKEEYPPFTTEKQLELIKWLGIRDEFNFYQNKVTKDWVFYDHEKDATHYNFELGLASWVDYLWQDLTEEERTQIKEILE